MARLQVAYNPDSPLIVRRAFDGHRVGDTFDASRVNFRRVAQLFRAGYLKHPDVYVDEPEPTLAPTAEVAETQPEPEPVVEVAPEPEPAPATTEPEPSAVEFLHLGSGWYNVVLAGTDIPLNETKLKGKTAAEEFAKENGYL